MASVDSSETSKEREDVVDFVSKLTGNARLRIEENLPHGFVRLKVAEAERRQAQQDIRSVEDIVTEMVRNSRDAGARHILVAFQKEQGMYRKIVVLDDGCGIPTDMHTLVFEPRVTSKSEDFGEDRYGVHGRGMALFSIRSRAMKVDIVASRPGQGSSISVAADTRNVPERSDQATLPRIEENDGSQSVGAGPHNVARVLVEMSIDHPEVDFYIGSFAEVLATARKLSRELSTVSLWSGLAKIDDARPLAEFSQTELGLPISERNAYRVLNDEIAPLNTIYRHARMAAGAGPKSRKQQTSPLHRGVRSRPIRRIAREDLLEMGSGCSEVVEGVVGRYYLTTSGAPRVRRGRGKIIISFFITGEEGEEE